MFAGICGMAILLSKRIWIILGVMATVPAWVGFAFFEPQDISHLLFFIAALSIMLIGNALLVVFVYRRVTLGRPNE